VRRIGGGRYDGGGHKDYDLSLCCELTTDDWGFCQAGEGGAGAVLERAACALCTVQTEWGVEGRAKWPGRHSTIRQSNAPSVVAPVPSSSTPSTPSALRVPSVPQADSYQGFTAL
jgi:hypothetical protein